MSSISQTDDTSRPSKSAVHNTRTNFDHRNQSYVSLLTDNSAANDSQLAYFANVIDKKVVSEEVDVLDDEDE